MPSYRLDELLDNGPRVLLSGHLQQRRTYPIDLRLLRMLLEHFSGKSFSTTRPITALAIHDAKYNYPKGSYLHAALFDCAVERVMEGSAEPCGTLSLDHWGAGYSGTIKGTGVAR